MASALTVLRLALIVPSVFGLYIPAPMPEGEALAPENKATVLPSDDPFYWAPKDFEKTERGTILRSRPVPNAITLNNVTPIKPKAAWQLLYRTQNSVGEPSANVVTVLVPFNVKPNHLFVYSMFTVRLAQCCL